jgi:hypothetical protein
MPRYPDAISFHAALVEMAEQLRQELVSLPELERRKLVTRIVDGSDMVFAVWPEGDGPGVAGVLLLKGAEMVPPLAGFELPGEVRLAAIACTGPLAAEAARRVLEERAKVDEADDEDATLEAADAPAAATDVDRLDLELARL